MIGTILSETYILEGKISATETLSGTIIPESIIQGTVVIPETVEVPVIPSNYGLITWNGSVLTVS